MGCSQAVLGLAPASPAREPAEVWERSAQSLRVSTPLEVVEEVAAQGLQPSQWAPLAPALAVAWAEAAPCLASRAWEEAVEVHWVCVEPSSPPHLRLEPDSLSSSVCALSSQRSAWLPLNLACRRLDC